MRTRALVATAWIGIAAAANAVTVVNHQDFSFHQPVSVPTSWNMGGSGTPIAAQMLGDKVYFVPSVDGRTSVSYSFKSDNRGANSQALHVDATSEGLSLQNGTASLGMLSWS